MYLYFVYQKLALTLLLSCLALVRAYPDYATRIPNGVNVKNPCDNELEGEAWPGVGHRNVAGGGTRNPFGLDFKANDYVRR